MLKKVTVPPHLRLNVHQVPPAFDGTLYFVLGPGLGDTVNDFRILHEVRDMYPKATLIIYADSRWWDLYQLIPVMREVPIRYHAPAPSGEMEGKGKQKPYYQTFQAIIGEICQEAQPRKGLVALGAFKCADQLVRKESSLAMKARAIGLSLSSERCRPYLPITEAQIEEARAFLEARGLRPEQFIAIAPHTFSDKMWAYESWEALLDRLQEATPLAILVFGVSGYPAFKGPRVREALGLSLSLVAGLLSQARCFVGLDSGLTHLAACFDVPIVTLNPQGKFPPFFVEAHTPFRWTHLTPKVYGNHPIPSQSVFELILRVLEFKTPSECPLCKQTPYVLGAEREKILYLCRCGLMFQNNGQTPSGVLPEVEIPNELSLPNTANEINGVQTGLQKRKKKAVQMGAVSPVSIQFQHWSPQRVCPEQLLEDSTGWELWWSWDSAVSFIKASGWQVLHSRVVRLKANDNALFSVTMKIVPGTPQGHGRFLKVPWGEKIIRVSPQLYERWLQWESFEKPAELEDLGWMLANQGYEKEGREILKLAIRLGPRGRTIRRLIRAEWKVCLACCKALLMGKEEGRAALD